MYLDVFGVIIYMVITGLPPHTCEVFGQYAIIHYKDAYFRGGHKSRLRSPVSQKLTFIWHYTRNGLRWVVGRTLRIIVPVSSESYDQRLDVSRLTEECILERRRSRVTHKGVWESSLPKRRFFGQEIEGAWNWSEQEGGFRGQARSRFCR